MRPFPNRMMKGNNDLNRDFQTNSKKAPPLKSTHLGPTQLSKNCPPTQEISPCYPPRSSRKTSTRKLISSCLTSRAPECSSGDTAAASRSRNGVSAGMLNSDQHPARGIVPLFNGRPMIRGTRQIDEKRRLHSEPSSFESLSLQIPRVVIRLTCREDGRSPSRAVCPADFVTMSRTDSECKTCR